VGQPAAAARDADRIDVFAPGEDGRLWHRWWDGREWVAWQPVAGAPGGVTAVAADWVGGRLDVYVLARTRPAPEATGEDERRTYERSDYAVGSDRSLWYVALITPA
jgi:hypothetical protein